MFMLQTGWIRGALLFFLCLLPVMQAMAQTSDDPSMDSLDSQFLVEDPDSESKLPVDITGYVEARMVAGDANRVDAAINAVSGDHSGWSRKGIVEAEGRVRLNGSYVGEYFKAQAIADLFLTPARDDLADPHMGKPLDPLDLYLQWGDIFRWRVGLQRFGWGTADLFHVVDYPDSFNFSRFLTEETDRIYRGRAALDFLYSGSGLSLEVALLPVHNPDLYAPRESYWYASPAASDLMYYDMRALYISRTSYPVALSLPQVIAFPVDLPSVFQAIPNGNMSAALNEFRSNHISFHNTPVLNEGESVAAHSRNFSGALRVGKRIDSVDLHFYYFNGVPSSPFYTMRMDASSTGAPVIEIDTRYGKEESLGMDFATGGKSFTFRGEISYNPAHWGASVKPDTWGRAAKGKMVGYTLSAEYMFHGDSGRFSVEWMDRAFLTPGMMAEMFRDIMALHIEETFFDSHLKPGLSILIRPTQRKPGYVVFPELTYESGDHLMISLGYFFIKGNGDDLLQPYELRDCGYLKIRYRFF